MITFALKKSAFLFVTINTAHALIKVATIAVLGAFTKYDVEGRGLEKVHSITREGCSVKSDAIIFY